MTPKISFIIPTLNEEKRIARIINQIKKLDKKYNYEIIIGDGNSTDRTREIAKKLGVKVIIENKHAPKTIANGRNTGASIATGDILIFSDADTMIPDPNKFMSEVISVFKDSQIVAGAPALKIFPDEITWKDKIFHYFYNNTIRLSFSTKSPVCGGQCQIIRGSAFRKINGYNSNIVHAEDTELFRRLRKLGKLHFFSKLFVYESPRRYRTIGYFRLFLQGVYSFVYQAIFRKNAFKEWKRVESPEKIHKN